MGFFVSVEHDLAATNSLLSCCARVDASIGPEANSCSREDIRKMLQCRKYHEDVEGAIF